MSAADFRLGYLSFQSSFGYTNLVKLIENNWSKTTGRKQLVKNNWSKTTGQKQLVENNWSKTTGRKQLVENSWSRINCRKLVEKQLAENSSAENSSQAKKSSQPNMVLCFVILLYYACYESFTHHLRKIN